MISKIKNRKHLKRNLENLIKIKRKEHHHLLHHIHKKHGISRKTLFYIKEYGSHSHVASTIIRESIFILLLTSFLSAFGGIALENIKSVFLVLVPFVILYPALSNMIGGYGALISSKFGTMLHEGKIKGSWWKNVELKNLYKKIFLIATVTAFIAATSAILLSRFSDFTITYDIALKIYGIALFDVLFLVSLLFFVSVSAGKYYFNKGEDPNNFLIPITTSIADLGNGLVLAGLIFLLF